MTLEALEKLGAWTFKARCTECGHVWDYSVGADEYGTTHKYINDVLHYWCPECEHTVTKFKELTK